MFGFAPPPDPLTRIAGLAARVPLPRIAAEAAARAVAAAVAARHPGLSKRLTGLGRRRIRFEPDGLPYAFVLSFAGGVPALRVVPAAQATGGATVVRGRLPLLLAMLEGRLDGDSAFFSRRLSIEGDTEPIVLLRNALEAEEIDIKADLAAACGPFEPLAGDALSLAESVVRAASGRARSARDWALGPLESSLSRHTARLGSLDERVSALEQRLARRIGGRREGEGA